MFGLYMQLHAVKEFIDLAPETGRRAKHFNCLHCGHNFDGDKAFGHHYFVSNAIDYINTSHILRSVLRNNLGVSFGQEIKIFDHDSI